MNKIVILLSWALVAIPGAPVLAADTAPVLEGAVLSSTVVEAVARPPAPGIGNRATHRHGVSRPVRKGETVSARDRRRALGERSVILRKRIVALEKSRAEARDERKRMEIDLQIRSLREELQAVAAQDRALRRSLRSPVPKGARSSR